MWAELACRCSKKSLQHTLTVDCLTRMPWPSWWSGTKRASCHTFSRPTESSESMLSGATTSASTSHVSTNLMTASCSTTLVAVRCVLARTTMRIWISAKANSSVPLSVLTAPTRKWIKPAVPHMSGRYTPCLGSSLFADSSQLLPNAFSTWMLSNLTRPRCRSHCTTVACCPKGRSLMIRLYFGLIMIISRSGISDLPFIAVTRQAKFESFRSFRVQRVCQNVQKLLP